MSRNRFRACAATQYFEGRQLSARRDSAVRLGSAPRLARIIFLAMMVGFTSACVCNPNYADSSYLTSDCNSNPGCTWRIVEVQPSGCGFLYLNRCLYCCYSYYPPPPPPSPPPPSPSPPPPSPSPPPPYPPGHSHSPHSHFPHSHSPHIHYPVAQNSSDTSYLKDLPTVLGLIIGLPAGGCLCLCLCLGLCLGLCLSRRRKEARGPPPLQRPTTEAHEPQPAVATKTNLTTQANLSRRRKEGALAAIAHAVHALAGARGPPPLQRPTTEAHEPQPAVATKTNLTTQANLNLMSA